MARLKKNVSTKPRLRGNKIVGPAFDGWENMEPAAFSKLQRSSYSFYYQDVKKEEFVKAFWDWMATAGYTKSQIALAKKGPDAGPTPFVYAKMLEDGCPDYNERYAAYWESLPGTSGKVKPITEYLKKSADAMIQRGEKFVEPETKTDEKAKTVYKPTIQQIIFEQAQDAVADVDEWLDSFQEKSFDPKGFNVKAHFTKKNVTQAHARKIIKMYQGEFDEYTELQNLKIVKGMSDREKDMLEQLKEGYSHLSKNDIKSKLTAIQLVIDACNFIIDSASAKRKTRKPKQRSAEKVIKDIKYQVAFAELNLASINPIEIIGANELWVYNTKTRKIGKYVASVIDPKGQKREGSGLTIKGTTLQGFDESASVQKTLRKPDEKLKEFKAAGKVALRKFMEDINSVESVLTGRINGDTILLKAL